MSASAATLPALLAARTGVARPLLVCDADRLGYNEAIARSAELARGLIALGACKGTHVGLLYPNGTDFVVAMLAVGRIGAVVVPFSTFATGAELHQQLRHSDIVILLAAASFRDHDYMQRVTAAVGDLGGSEPIFAPDVPNLRHVVFGPVATATLPARNIEHVYRLADSVDPALLAAVEHDVEGSDPLAIVYTSGSTGAPKGAVHSHEGLLAHQARLNQIRGLTEHETLFCNSPFFWIGGFAFGLLATLVAGATLVCSNATDAGDTLDLIEAERPTMTNGFVAGITHLTQHPSFAARDLSSMRRGNLYPLMAPDVRPRDPELRHNMLGMTESGSVVLLSGDETDQPEHRRGSFGRPAPGVETKIIDLETKDDVAIGDVGELCLRGPNLMLRHHRRSREECFDTDDWFHTGDLVRADRDGFVYYLGRRDAMIKTAGANVSPVEVERAIARVTGGAAAHVVGLPHAERGQIVAAAVVVEHEGDLDEAALLDKLRTELSTYKIPRRVVPLAPSAVPVLSSGKVDRRQLMKVFDV
ncbi:acyl--CoA ligase [Aldersonia sp. NBC_00410]|uniref:class I adenylate-forming enzyme family protein n=1 Tax=Aldersonia sp. NBC_00410 TaxID=2975954 RepID=UPI002258A35E|nr:class I adenylate-forming enzyme family protein [Aldersonia sp. NBC_00410]MCX5045382.1 acyl--CoA ligase [Aldersonia sp. NBC_00410]